MLECRSGASLSPIACLLSAPRSSTRPLSPGRQDPSWPALPCSSALVSLLRTTSPGGGTTVRRPPAPSVLLANLDACSCPPPGTCSVPHRCHTPTQFARQATHLGGCGFVRGGFPSRPLPRRTSRFQRTRKLRAGVDPSLLCRAGKQISLAANSSEWPKGGKMFLSRLIIPAVLPFASFVKVVTLRHLQFASFFPEITRQRKETSGCAPLRTVPGSLCRLPFSLTSQEAGLPGARQSAS